MTWWEHRNVWPGVSYKTFPKDWCYEDHFESLKVLTCIYYSHCCTGGLASLKFSAPLVKSSGLLSFLHLQIHPPITGHFLPRGAVALHVAVLWLFPHFSWRRCTTASCLTGRRWELMLLGKVCFVKSVVQPIGNILREFQIKDNSSSDA